MKVLNKGDCNQVACACCGSVLAYAPEDVIRTYTGFAEGEEVSCAYSVLCPVCGHEVSIANVSDAMRERIKRARVVCRRCGR